MTELSHVVGWNCLSLVPMDVFWVVGLTINYKSFAFCNFGRLGVLLWGFDFLQE